MLCVTACLSVSQSVRLCVWGRQPVNLSVRLAWLSRHSGRLSVSLSVRLRLYRFVSVGLSVCPFGLSFFACTSLCLPVCLFVCQSVSLVCDCVGRCHGSRLPAWLPARLVCLCACPFVFSIVCLSVCFSGDPQCMYMLCAFQSVPASFVKPRQRCFVGCVPPRLSPRRFPESFHSLEAGPRSPRSIDWEMDFLNLLHLLEDRSVARCRFLGKTHPRPLVASGC